MHIKRTYCERCSYPSGTCLCKHFETVSAPIELTILQDKWEAKHAKNTGRLVALCIENTQIINVDTDPSALNTLKQKCLEKPIKPTLLFPLTHAHPIEKLAIASKQQINELIVIDTTWRKAKRIMHEHPWLAHLSCVSCEQVPVSKYDIRKSAFTGGVSSLEAIAYSLKVLYGFEAHSLYTCFDALKQNWKDYSPD